MAVRPNQFKKAVNKLHPNQKRDLDKAVQAIMKDPALGQPKTGDLAGVLVYQFNMVKQLTLLAYTHQDQTITLTLLALGTHEGFYRGLKKSV